ncbi:hypothetical protein Mgra_00003130 [Meloidogyne graminicola]|uniref:Uncharacterized protein n=1 Tax=Meloidogyne graminicola TaxID=189291 RepID=A0A8S9ZV09_9BILA|nr:hypothetical protein Mgra_00003130 [Meloidogyne graminicola]
MASSHQSRYYEQSQREERGLSTRQHEESLRDMEQIRHTNATLDVAGSDAFRAQTEQAAIRIVTPHYKIPEKPGTDVQIGSSLQDLSSKLTDAADYKAERAAEHFRMQIIDPRVASHAHIPAHAIRDYARRHLIDDFPSLHGKRSFLDLEALDQLRIRPKGKLGDATDRDKDLDKFLKNRDGKPWELANPPKVDDDSLRELDRLRNNIDNLQKSSFNRSKSLNKLHEIINEQMEDNKKYSPSLPSPPPPLLSDHHLIKVLPIEKYFSDKSITTITTTSNNSSSYCSSTISNILGKKKMKRFYLKIKKKKKKNFCGNTKTELIFVNIQPTKSCLKQSSNLQGVSNYSLHNFGNEPDGESWEDKGEINLNKQRLDLIKQMQKNLELQRKQKQINSNNYPTVPFGGPFFKLVEVGNEDEEINVSLQTSPLQLQSSEWIPHYQKIIQNNIGEEKEEEEINEERIIYWPYHNPKNSFPKQIPSPPKNLKDPERLEEFLRQERMQKEAESLRLKKENELRDKQLRAIQQQQQQQNNNIKEFPPSTSSTIFYPSLSDLTNKNIRIFETRPISAEETLNSSEFLNKGTWKRTFTLDSRNELIIDERNEILTSDERLIRDKFNIDLLKRRESFIEKPEYPPEIKRIGKRWQPLKEQPYKWPTQQQQQQFPLSIQTEGNNEWTGEKEEYNWEPIIKEPLFKKETKRFTPEHSPPNSPIIKGYGTGPLDNVAKKQTIGVILPSPDGSHRPKTEFSKIRKSPAAGFIPHAPNVLRISKEEGKEIKERGIYRNNTTYNLKEEENLLNNRKLPRHSSTIVQLGPLPRIEVRRRIKLLEAKQQQQQQFNHQRSRSAISYRPSTSNSFIRSPSAQRTTAPTPPPSIIILKEKLNINTRPIPRADYNKQQKQKQLLFYSKLNKSLECSANSSESCLTERSIIKVEPPAPIQRREVIRREIIKAPTTKHTVHRIEEKKRTEEVERRIVRRERRHKSRRVHRGYHSSASGGGGGGHDYYHYGSWGERRGGGGGGEGGYRSRSASRRSGYANGFSEGGERNLPPISYEVSGNKRFGGDSERYFHSGHHGRYGSVTDSLRRGETKYMPNGELKLNGNGTLKHHRVHKAHSTRDVYHHGDEGIDTGSRHSFYQRREPFIEFPPSLNRRSEWSPPEPPSHRQHVIDEFRGGQLTKARSFADWGEEGRGRSVFGSRGYDEDMAKLENEFRDARLMRIPSGNMYEKQHHHREIPGGYETYEREVKAHSDRKLNGGGNRGGMGGEKEKDIIIMENLIEVEMLVKLVIY